MVIFTFPFFLNRGPIFLGVSRDGHSHVGRGPEKRLS